MRLPGGVLAVVLLLSACAPLSSEHPVGEPPDHGDGWYDAPLRYPQHRAQQQFIPTSSGRIAYTDHGRGPVLLLLHGVPTSSWMYRKIIPDLQQHFRVISVDLLGYGSSDKPKDDGAVYSNTAQAIRLTQLLSALGVTDYSMLMHDMGGLVAWELLRMTPAAVTRLVILNTIVHRQGFNSPTLRPGLMTRQLTKAYSSRMTSAAILTLSFRSLGLSGEHKLSEPECFGYVQPMREGADQALYAFFTQLDEPLFAQLDANKAVFSEFSGETLVLWGGRDDILTTAQIPFLQEHLSIPESNIHIYPDNKHFLAEEIPAELVAKVVAFMSNEVAP